MTEIKKPLLSALSIVLFFIIALASSPSKKTFKNSESWIPKDFNPNKTILLVEKFSISNRAEQNMEDYMNQKYPYKFEFVDFKTIKNREGKYADTKLYKYALVISSHSSTLTKAQGASTNAGLTTTGFDFNFYDRDLDKNYPATKRPSSYAITTFKPVINTIVKHFE
jgi:hypothetical protein